MANPYLRYERGDRIGERFEVHSALAGGFSEVYLCIDLHNSGRPYALKTPRAEFITDIGVLDAFHREAERWIRIGQHPNVVTCHLMTRLDNAPFLALDWVRSDSEDPSLRHLLLRRLHSFDLAMRIGIGVSRAMIHAQKSVPGLVHGDIKPENILVTSRGIPLVTDFGTARLPIDALPGTARRREHVTFGSTRPLGTRAYAAPELLRRDACDTRADIYSLGIVLMEIVDGVSQKRRESESGVMTALEGESAGAIDPDVRAILSQCVEREPGNRPGTFEELCAVLEQVASHSLGSELQQHVTPMGAELASERLTNQGIVFFELGRYGAALQVFSRALELQPSAKDYLHRSMVLSKLGRHVQALQDSERALAMDSELAEAWIAHGLALEGTHDLPAAITAYTSAIKIDPTAAAAFSNRGRLYLLTGNAHEGLKDLDEAVTREPTRDTYFNRGVARAVGGEFKPALEDFDAAIAIDPLSADPYFMKGKTLGLMQDYYGAIPELLRALELDPGNSETSYLLGLSFLHCGGVGMAKTLLLEARRLGHPTAAALLSRIEAAGLDREVSPDAALDILPLVNRVMDARSADDIQAMVRENRNINWEQFLVGLQRVEKNALGGDRETMKTRLRWLEETLRERLKQDSQSESAENRTPP